MTNEHDQYYGFSPNMTTQERRHREQEISRTVLATGGELNDEDTPDAEGMADRYEADPHIEEYDIANDR